MLARSDRAVTVPTAATATPEWMAARSAWFSHLSECEKCRKYHRLPVLKRGPSRCGIGDALELDYSLEPIWR